MTDRAGAPTRDGRDRLAALSRVIDHVLPWRYPILAAWTALCFLQHVRGTGADWEYFVTGSRFLFGTGASGRPGGLHIYASHPDIQIGPLSLLVATPLRFLGPGAGRLTTEAVMSGVGLMLVYVLERAAASVHGTSPRACQRIRMTVLVGGLIAIQAWVPLSTIYAHLDDVLALAGGTAALWAVSRDRPWLGGTAVGLAIAAKPWAVVFCGLLVAFSGRRRRPALAAAAGIGVAAWLPFVVGDPGTLHAMHPYVLNAVDSPLRLIGVHDPMGPAWVRPVQFIGGAALGLLAAWRGRWAAVVLVGVAFRIAIDPGSFLYYSAGLVLGALGWDLLGAERRLPIWTLLTFVLLDDAYVIVPSPSARAVLRLTVASLVVAGALLDRRSPHHRVARVSRRPGVPAVASSPPV